VYGSPDHLPYAEDFALIGLYPYDVSKTCTDLIAQSFAHTFDMPVSITRSANIYGPADVNVSRVIPGTILSILKGERPIIRSDGTPIRDFIYTDDIAAGYMLLAEQIDQSRGQAFNFGSGTPVTMQDLVTRIIGLMAPGSGITPDIMLAGKIQREIDAQYLSSEKVNSMFGWSPAIDLDTGLQRTIDWYSNNADLTAAAG